MGVLETKQYEKYLGFPSLVGRNKKASFNYIKENVGKKIQRWKEKILSQAGREVLIKAMVQAIPPYTMSCFKLLISLCKKLKVSLESFSGGKRASHSTSSSYAWHSILKGHDVLLKGAKWRVRCGESIGVWNYACLPSLKQLRILSTPIDDFEETRVCEFIDPVSKQ
ncbi:uncharacterized protein LOC142609005 [Castanea sativa]|uniref:uncharacterized protein LOC142609005 n=1 Tax=Castanea sativa TaxID=21020 RepID=UPI003F64CEA1